MIDLYRDTLSIIEKVFHDLAGRIEPPEVRPLTRGFVYRYRSESLEAAIIQKLARVVSGLHACLALLERGLVQELGALQRMLDEFTEAIFFLCNPLVGGERTPLHEEYLRYFYQEEFDPHGNPFLSEQSRPQVSRRKIQAANARVTAAFVNPSDGQELLRSLDKALGGFVHGASPHIMEMYGGNPPRFHVGGMLGTSRVPELVQSLWHYFHRAINMAALAALALKDAEANQLLLQLRQAFEATSGQSAAGDAAVLVENLKSPRKQG